MENWQDEIIKAQISQEIGVERSMENSDISVFLKSFKENLIGAVDRDSFDKSWSSDLQSKFPSGSWRTVNGARVFINNGKVIAGLDGFNGEIDKFFEGKGKKESGKSGDKLQERTDKLLKEYYEKDKGTKEKIVKMGVSESTAKIEAKKRGSEFFVKPDSNEKGKFQVIHNVKGDADNLTFEQYKEKYGKQLEVTAKNQLDYEAKHTKTESGGKNATIKELSNQLNESHKTGKELSGDFYSKFTKLSKEDQSKVIESTDSHEVLKEKREALEKILRSGSDKQKTTDKEVKEESTDEPLESWQEVQLNAYNKDKKGYIKRTLETASTQSERAKKQLNDWIEEAKNKEYRDMLLNIKSELDKVEEKAKQQSDKLEAEKKNIAKFTDSETHSLSSEKMLQGDVYDNFKQYNEYVKAARKEKKHKEAGFIVPNYKEQEELFKENTTALKKERDIKVRQEDSHKALMGVAAKDELRPSMNGVYYDPDGYAVSTDGHTLLAVETDTKENSGKIIDKDGKEIEDHFPNWRGVVPERYTESVNLDLSDIHSLSKQSKDIGSWVDYKQVTVSLSDSIDARYSAEKVLAITMSLRKLGIENVKASYSSDQAGNRALRLDGKTKDGKSVVGLLMPMHGEKATFKLEKQ